MKVLMVQSGKVFQKIFGAYDGVKHCNIRMKDSVLIYEKLKFVPVVYMLQGLKKPNLKRVDFVNQRASRKSKLRRQISRGKEMSKNGKVLEKGYHIYVTGKKLSIFWYI